MFAIRHPEIRNLYFDFNACTWTFDKSKRTLFDARDTAADWATLTQDGGLVVVAA